MSNRNVGTLLTPIRIAVREPLQRLLESSFAEVASRADEIGPDIDGDLPGHAVCSP
jgi:hypothetical protein